MPATEPPRQKRRLYSELIALLTFYGGLAYFGHLSHVSPHTQTPSTGQTHELNNHGYFFYVRLPELVWLYGLLAAPLIAIVILATMRNKNQPATESPRWVMPLNVVLVVAVAIYIYSPLPF